MKRYNLYRVKLSDRKQSQRIEAPSAFDAVKMACGRRFAGAMCIPSALTKRNRHESEWSVGVMAGVKQLTITATVQLLDQAVGLNNPHPRDLLKELSSRLPAIPPVDAMCHAGIVHQNKCQRCSDIMRQHDIVNALLALEM